MAVLGYQRWQHTLRMYLMQIVVALLYLLSGLTIHHYITSHGIVSIFWPGSGLALAALLIGGRRFIWAVLLGSLLLNTLTNGSFWAIFGITLADVLGAYLGYWLLTRKNQSALLLSTLPDYMRLIILGGGIATTVNALIGPLSLLYAGIITPANYFENVIHWWMGDLLGAMLVAPLILVWWQAKLEPLTPKKMLEMLLLIGSTFIVGQIIFLGWFSEHLSDAPKGYYLFLFVSLAAIRLGKRGTTLSVTMIAIQGLSGALKEVGFFAHDIARADLSNYWAYMLTLTFVGMAIASYISEIKLGSAALKLKESALNATASGIVITDLAGRIEWANQAFCKVTGFSLRESYGHNPRDLIKSGQQDEAYYKKLWDTIVAKKTWQGELINKRKDGSLYHEEMTITPILNETDEITHFVAVKQDITERRYLKDAQEKALSLLQNITNLVPGVVYQYQLRPDGSSCFPYASSAINEIYRVTPEEVREDASPVFANLHPDDFDGIVESIQKSATELIPWKHEYRVKFKDGSVRWLSGDALPRKDSDGSVLWHGYISDITERKQIDFQRDLLMKIIEEAPDFIATSDMQSNLLFLNKAGARLVGLPEAADLSTLQIKDMHPEWATKRVLEEGIPAVLEKGYWHSETALLNKQNGHVTPVSQLLLVHRDANGKPEILSTIMRDITDRKAYEIQHLESEQNLLEILKLSPIAVRIASKHGHRVVFSNQRYSELIKSDHPMGDDPGNYYAHPKEYEEILEAIDRGEVVMTKVIELNIPGGRAVWALASYMPMKYQGEDTVLGWFYDITERKLMEEEIKQLAFYDPLTSLPNRRLLNDRLSQIMSASQRSGLHAALMFLDLDNFKPLNDAHGHEVGDLLLIEVAERINNCVRGMDTVARFGGDEFVVMLSELEENKTKSTVHVLAVAEKIRTSLSEPFLLTISHEGHADTKVSHRCTVSIGVVVFLNHEGIQDDILKWADEAMYQAKEAGRNQIRFYKQ